MVCFVATFLRFELLETYKGRRKGEDPGSNSSVPVQLSLSGANSGCTEEITRSNVEEGKDAQSLVGRLGVADAGKDNHCTNTKKERERTSCGQPIPIESHLLGAGPIDRHSSHVSPGHHQLSMLLDLSRSFKTRDTIIACLARR